MGWFNWGGTGPLHDKVTLQHFQHARCMESLLPWLSDIAGSDRAALYLVLMAAQLQFNGGASPSSMFAFLKSCYPLCRDKIALKELKSDLNALNTDFKTAFLQGWRDQGSLRGSHTDPSSPVCGVMADLSAHPARPQAVEMLQCKDVSETLQGETGHGLIWIVVSPEDLRPLYFMPAPFTDGLIDYVKTGRLLREAGFEGDITLFDAISGEELKGLSFGALALGERIYSVQWLEPEGLSREARKTALRFCKEHGPEFLTEPLYEDACMGSCDYDLGDGREGRMLLFDNETRRAFMSQENRFKDSPIRNPDERMLLGGFNAHITTNPRLEPETVEAVSRLTVTFNQALRYTYMRNTRLLQNMECTPFVKVLLLMLSLAPWADCVHAATLYSRQTLQRAEKVLGVLQRQVTPVNGGWKLPSLEDGEARFVQAAGWKEWFESAFSA